MTYKQTLDKLYKSLPSFQNSGSEALRYKLQNILDFTEYLGQPQEKFKSIHIAGTNGKGSSSHLIASILQEAGFKVGLYTSPHLKDFRERFKINGKMVSKKWVVDFVKIHDNIITKIKPSFFEITVAMAFQLFKEEQVDFAVIEVGLGGRLDSTNIINPLACLITNIGLDHTDILGETLEKIAYEKAGIIKQGVPVCISERQVKIEHVFKAQSDKKKAPLYFADKHVEVSQIKITTNFLVKYKTSQIQSQLKSPLHGNYQSKNIAGVLAFFEMLKEEKILELEKEVIHKGIAKVINNTQLKGRWQILSMDPLCVCDTGHNLEAFKYLIEYFKASDFTRLHLILGFSKDKNLEGLFDEFPKNSFFYLSSFNSPRCKNPREIALDSEMNVKYFNNVNEAIALAQSVATPKDIIFIGGSTYLVAEIKNL